MIPVPPALAALGGKALIWAAFAACFFLVGMGAHKAFSDRKIAALKLAYAEEVAQAETARAQAERLARAVERRWAQDVEEREEEYAMALRKRDVVVRELVVAGNGLRDALARYTRTGGATENPDAAVGDLRQRVTTLGALLAEIDGLAEESSRAADNFRDELALCRDYARVVSK